MLELAGSLQHAAYMIEKAAKVTLHNIPSTEPLCPATESEAEHRC